MSDVLVQSSNCITLNFFGIVVVVVALSIHSTFWETSSTLSFKPFTEFKILLLHGLNFFLF